MYSRVPSLSSFVLLGFGAPLGNTAEWTSSEVYRPARQAGYVSLPPNLSPGTADFDARAYLSELWRGQAYWKGRDSHFDRNPLNLRGFAYG